MFFFYISKSDHMWYGILHSDDDWEEYDLHRTAFVFGWWLCTYIFGSQSIHTISSYCDSNCEKNFSGKNKQTNTQPDDFLKFLTYIDMTHEHSLFHRLLVSETQTDRQDRFVIDMKTTGRKGHMSHFFTFEIIEF